MEYSILVACSLWLKVVNGAPFLSFLLCRTAEGIKVVDSYHYDDGDETTKEDTFQREPFVVRFHIPQLGNNPFIINCKLSLYVITIYFYFNSWTPSLSAIGY